MEAASMSATRSHLLPARVRPDLCLPALSFWPGQSPAQLARCWAVGNCRMSTPISATRTSAVRGAAGDAEDIGGHGRELDAGVFEHLVEAIGLPGAFLDQDLAIASEVAQFAQRRGWHEAAPQQPVLQQLGEPDAILHVGFPAGDLLDVGGVDQHTGHGLFEHVVDGLPVDAGALEGDMGDAVGLEPVPQGDELGRGGTEGADVLAAIAALVGDAYTHGDGLPMDIQSG